MGNRPAAASVVLYSRPPEPTAGAVPATGSGLKRG